MRPNRSCEGFADWDVALLAAVAGLGPAQMLLQEREGALSVDAVRALEEFNLGPVAESELRVKEANLPVLVRHPFVAPDQIEMATLHHERPRNHEIGHFR